MKKLILGVISVASAAWFGLDASAALSAALYRSSTNALRVDTPINACNLKPFTYQLQLYGQVFRGAVYPDLTLIPCSRYEPSAFFGGSFRVYKVTGDRTEACRGDVSIRFSNYGRELILSFVNRGSLPGHYCRDRRKTSHYRLYRR
jgi:hypothetical protein